MARSAKARGAAAARVRSVPVSESELHRVVADFLDWILLPPAVWTTFPAGWTAMRKGAAGRLKGAGLKAGMPDILLFHGGRAAGIELKGPKGKRSQEQVDMTGKLNGAGIPVFLCYSVSEVRSTLEYLALPMRSHDLGNPPSKTRRPPQPDARAPQA